MSIADGDLKEKDLLGIPWMLAFALRADGWFLRSDIIWHKPNPMPESVTDRPTSSHEHVFLLAKSPTYFYDADAIREPDCGNDHARTVLAGQPSLEPSNGLASPHRGLRTVAGRDGLGRNKRNVWTVSPQPFPGAHFATFPMKLIEPCILAGSAERACGECGAPWKRVVERTPAAERSMLVGASAVTLGFAPSCDHDDGSATSTVLDPFAGAGTTGVVALRHGRSFVGVELSATYAEMARERIRRDAPLFNVAGERVVLRNGLTSRGA